MSTPQAVARTEITDMPSSASALEIVLRHQVPDVWNDIEPMVAAALAESGGAFAPEDIFRHLLDGSMVAWLSRGGDEIEACAVTQIMQYPRKRVLAIPLVGGRNMNAWIKFQAAIEAFGRSQGCTHVNGFIGRQGWRRVLRDQGWRDVFTVIEKEL